MVQFSGILSGVLNAPLAVAQGAETGLTEPVALPGMGGMFLRMVGSLLLILVLTYLVLHFIRKQQNLQQRQKRWIKILDYQALGTNRGIYLVELLQSTYIVASSEGQISILKEVDTTDENWEDILQYLKEAEEAPPPGMKTLAQLLQRMKVIKQTQDDDFQTQLQDHINRSRQLSDKVRKGGKGNE